MYLIVILGSVCSVFNTLKKIPLSIKRLKILHKITIKRILKILAKCFHGVHFI